MLTVIYEGHCVFCNWCKDFVERRSTEIIFIDYNDPGAYELLSGNPDFFELRKETIIVLEQNRHPLIKFEACRRIARFMYAPWPTISTLLGIVPTFIGNFGYDLIAKNRPFLSRLVGSRD